MSEATVMYAAKGDNGQSPLAKASIANAHFSDRERLIATYVDDENQFWYAVSESLSTGKSRIRKMSIKRDVEYARKINRKAKGLIDLEVRFGCTAGWNPNVWFNDIVGDEITEDDIPF